MLKLKLKPDSSPAAEGTTKDSDTESKRIKLSLNVDKGAANPVRIRLRTNKTLADGYDVEAPDREEDPTVEEAIVLRMLPGVPALAKLHKACDTNDFSGINVNFEDRRHAIVTVDNEEFAAQLMDLPTITEIHKSVDRRNIFKTVDVSQILLVTHKLGDPAPDMREYTRFTGDPQAFPHGLTPPLYNVRNRRFQRRISTKAVESLEAQVEELLRKDAAAKEVKTELLPVSAIAAQQALAEAARAAAQARAEESDDMEVDDELDEELERAMMDDEEEDDEDDEDGARDGQAASEDEEDEDDDDEDDDRQAADRDDDDYVRNHNKQLREEIKDLQITIEAKEKVAGTVVNDIMRARHMDAVTRLRAELEKKKSLLRDADGAEKQISGEAEENESDADEDDEEDDEDEVEEEEEEVVDINPTNSAQPSAPERTPADEEEDRLLEAQLGEQLGDAMQDDEDDIDSLF